MGKRLWRSESLRQWNRVGRIYRDEWPLGRAYSARLPNIGGATAVILCGLVLSGCAASGWTSGDNIIGDAVGKSCTTSGPPSSPTTSCITPVDPPVARKETEGRAGATVSLSAPLPNSPVSGFVRTGLLIPVSGGSSTGAVPELLNGASATGQAGYKERYTVPLYGGVSVPATSLGLPIPNVSFEAFAGAQVRNKELSLSLLENGAGVSTSQRYTTLDPAFGIGLQYDLGTISNVRTSLGANYTYTMALNDRTLSLSSKQFPGIAYTLTDPRHSSGAFNIGLNFDISAAPSYASVARKSLAAK
jgi:hypothetical protein